ncbi:MAG: ATP-binding cassette domain-containing protein [Corallococcus sp.]|nr:ATP-binding cassette domain-containing protein [Corallococcus sp.]MCM1359572.1 ATP-binding cassette domain-containing protein [Corallococcus sp.]MCM1395164.1 ATP-binding cassette domain-containing protein [Corallococcus sp.]
MKNKEKSVVNDATELNTTTEKSTAAVAEEASQTTEIPVETNGSVQQKDVETELPVEPNYDPSKDYILRVRGLKQYFPVSKNFFGKTQRYLRAVDGVSFNLERGKTIGIVGESGCGKTTLGRTILRLYDITEGSAMYFDQNGKSFELAKLKHKELTPLRTELQLVFQDPYSSLPPRMTVGAIISEAVKVHNIVPKSEVHDYVLDVMKRCGLQRHYYDRYPHEFSGGQRQRICIARALAVKPKLVICDEPVSALDVSIQAQVINLLKKLQQEEGISYMFISHDLSVVKYISDTIAVMYLGNIVEFGSTSDICEHASHPYTQALFSAVPVPNPHRKAKPEALEGELPSPANPPAGCKFHTRCKHCTELCKKVAPAAVEISKGHFVSCHLFSNEKEKE